MINNEMNFLISSTHTVKDFFLSINELESLNNELHEQILQAIETFDMLYELSNEDLQNTMIVNKLVIEKKNILDMVNNYLLSSLNEITTKKILDIKKYMRVLLDEKINDIKKKRSRFKNISPVVEEIELNDK